MRPIINLTKKSNKKFKWTPIISEALKKIKYCFISELLLRWFNLTKSIYLFMNASGYIAAAILMQNYKNWLQPIVFWSRKFTTAKQNYLIMEKELLSIIEALFY